MSFTLSTVLQSPSCSDIFPAPKSFQHFLTGPTAIKNTCNFSASTLYSHVYSSKDQASPFSYSVTH